jgi:hypothetical protein
VCARRIEKGAAVKKRIYQLSLIGLGVGAVGVLAFGLAQRASKARHDAVEALGDRPGPNASEGEALSSPVHDPIIAERMDLPPRDEAMAEIWGADAPMPERGELLELSPDILSDPDLRGETYDGVEPENLGAEWLARATEAPPFPLLSPRRPGALSPEESLTSSEPDDDDERA